MLAISGSLRAASSNGVILAVASRVAPEGVRIDRYDGLGALPHFDPDLDRELDDPRLPAAVRELRDRVAAADAVLISSPEYAHGVPGSLKNALDWLVGGPEMVAKRVALWNTSPRSTHAQASLAETLRTMSAEVVADAGVSLSLGGRTDVEAIAGDPAIAPRLRGALDALRGRASSR